MALLPLATFAILSLIAAPANAQRQDWPLVVAEGHFSFPLPPSLELAKDSYEPARVNGRDVLTVAGTDFAVMAQPKGYRETDRGAQIRPAAIIVRVENGAPGMYATLGRALSIPPDELAQMNDDLRAGFVEEGAARGELSDVEWNGTQVVQLEGTQAIRFRYAANVGGGADRMAVNTYLVQNNDCMYYITLSYLLREQKNWVDDLTIAMEAMRFEARN